MSSPRRDQFADKDYRSVLDPTKFSIVPHSVIQLQHEIMFFHPQLIESIIESGNIGEEFETHIGTIAAYCGITLDSDKDGEYNVEELCKRLCGALRGSRILGHGIVAGIQ